MANSSAIIRIYVDKEKTKGRKIYFVAKLTSVDESVVFAEATSLFVRVALEKVLKKMP